MTEPRLNIQNRCFRNVAFSVENVSDACRGRLYPAAEMKHGPFALLDEHVSSVVIIPSDAIYEKALSNLQVVKARKGPIIAIATEGDEQIASHADDVINLPATIESLFPLLAVIPLQLLAYHIAVARGCDVDKPRNLDKKVWPLNERKFVGRSLRRHSVLGWNHLPP